MIIRYLMPKIAKLALVHSAVKGYDKYMLIIDGLKAENETKASCNTARVEIDSKNTA